MLQRPLNRAELVLVRHAVADVNHKEKVNRLTAVRGLTTDGQGLAALGVLAQSRVHLGRGKGTFCGRRGAVSTFLRPIGSKKGDDEVALPLKNQLFLSVSEKKVIEEEAKLLIKQLFRVEIKMNHLFGL